MAGPLVERRLAAILAADVVGYTRLIELDEAGTLVRLKRLRQEVIEPILARHGGRIVKLLGDGALVEFGSAAAAVQAAVEVQRAVAESGQHRGEATPIQFRIGISLGDVVHEDDDVFGEGVNLAARLEALADPGGICLSGAVVEQARNRVPVGLAAMGRQRLKNFAEPVEVWRVVPDGATTRRWLRHWRSRSVLRLAAAFLLLVGISLAGWWWQRLASPPTSATPSMLDRPAIAVLPFDDLGGEERQQRLADGFTEDLITELARSPELMVIARNSVETFEAAPVDVREVGRRLGVRYVLEGSLQLEPERVRITAQLIDASTGAHLWAERYDRPPDDLFAVRDEVLERLVGTLTGYDGPIWAAWANAAKRRPPESLGAWDYYLLANAPYRRHDKEGNAEARQLLEKAIALDPNFARAYAFLSSTHGQDFINGWSGDRAKSRALVRQTTERAAALDPNDGFIQSGLGEIYFDAGEIELGRAAWQRALAISPNDALVNRSIGTVTPIALRTEHAEEAVRMVRRALDELDPLHPPFQYLSLGIPLYFAGRFAEAAAALEQVPEPWLEPRVMMALSYAQAGDRERARAGRADPATRARLFRRGVGGQRLLSARRYLGGTVLRWRA
jgi:TolB-like protein/class 3 adenylate cyclase/Tfp pilus assembly protein PilF